MASNSRDRRPETSMIKSKRGLSAGRRGGPNGRLLGERSGNARFRRNSPSRPVFKNAEGRTDAFGEKRAEEGEKKYRYFAFWKPFGVSVRFDEDKGVLSLSHYIQIPKLYVVGVPDQETEGLMLLTDDPRFRYALTHPACRERRIFLAQVEGEVLEEALGAISEGVLLKDGQALPVDAEVIETPKLPERSVPVRERKSIPTNWLSLDTKQGWSRHVRRLTAAVGHPTLRLLQWAVGPVSLMNMQPGLYRILSYEELRWVNQVIEDAPEPRNRAERLRHARKLRPVREPEDKAPAARRSERWSVRRSSERSEPAERPGKLGSERSRRPRRPAEGDNAPRRSSGGPMHRPGSHRPAAPRREGSRNGFGAPIRGNSPTRGNAPRRAPLGNRRGPSRGNAVRRGSQASSIFPTGSLSRSLSLRRSLGHRSSEQASAPLKGLTSQRGLGLNALSSKNRVVVRSMAKAPLKGLASRRDLGLTRVSNQVSRSIMRTVASRHTTGWSKALALPKSK